MKILMLSWEYPPLVEGGLAAHVKGLSEALAAVGHQVHVLTPGEETIDEEINGVKVYRINFGSFSTAQFPVNIVQDNFGLVAKAAELIEKEKFHLLHAHDWLVGYAAQTLKHMYHLPLVVTIHATEKGRNRGIHNSLQWYIHQMEWGLTFEAWHTICCSNFMLKELQESFSLPEDKVSVIANGIAPASFKQNSPFKKGNYALPHEKVVFSVGRLVYEKGFQLLIDAAPIVLEHFPETKFIIAGKGYYLEDLKQKVNFLGLEDKFFFTGFISDEERNFILKLSSAVVFPSLYEPFGIVALEALATEAPVIVSDIGGLAEVIEEGVTGLKFIPNDPHSLADKIKYFLVNPDQATVMGISGGLKVHNFFSWEKIAKKTEEVYLRVFREFTNSTWGKNKRILVWSGFSGKEFEGTAKSLATKEAAGTKTV